MNILNFGGSFNPIHRGHLVCAQAVAHATGFEQVRLIPSARPPHKRINADLAAPADRLAMCRLAANENPLFTVDDVELLRSGPSYTIDTVRDFLRRGEVKVSWLIGADMLNTLPTWMQAEALVSEAQFVIMARPGFQFAWQTLPPPFRKLQQCVVEAPLTDISATDIRRRIRSGLAITDCVPRAVEEYIRTHHLYADPLLPSSVIDT